MLAPHVSLPPPDQWKNLTEALGLVAALFAVLGGLAAVAAGAWKRRAVVWAVVSVLLPAAAALLAFSCAAALSGGHVIQAIATAALSATIAGLSPWTLRRSLRRKWHSDFPPSRCLCATQFQRPTISDEMVTIYLCVYNTSPFAIEILGFNGSADLRFPAPHGSGQAVLKTEKAGPFVLASSEAPIFILEGRVKGMVNGAIPFVAVDIYAQVRQKGAAEYVTVPVILEGRPALVPLSAWDVCRQCGCKAAHESERKMELTPGTAPPQPAAKASDAAAEAVKTDAAEVAAPENSDD